jgi:hypothetical protein
MICSSLPWRMRFTRASAIGKSERGRGAVRIRSRDALWAAKAAPPSVILGWTRRSLANFFVALRPCRTCCWPDICSSLPWWLGSPGLPGIDKSSMMVGEFRAAWDVGRGPMPLIPAAVTPELAGSLGGTETQFYIDVNATSKFPISKWGNFVWPVAFQ